MNIAICISGHLRNWKENKSAQDFIKYIQSIYRTDVFVSTWDRENATKSWSEMHGLSNLERCKNIVHKEEVYDFYGATDVTVLNEEFYASDFSPLRYSILTKELFNWNSHGQQNGILHSTKMYFLIYMANLLKQKNEFKIQKKYDLVFRLRPDFEPFEEKYKNFDFNNILEDVLYIRKPPGSNICDQFAFGDSNIMDKYSSTFLKISTLLSQGIFGDPEEFLFRNLAEMKTNVHLLNPQGELFGFGCLGSEIVKDFKR